MLFSVEVQRDQHVGSSKMIINSSHLCLETEVVLSIPGDFCDLKHRIFLQGANPEPPVGCLAILTNGVH